MEINEYINNYLEKEKSNIRTNKENFIRDKVRLNEYILKKKNQHGGDYLEKIKQISKLYDEIDTEEIKERAQKTTELIDSIIKKINTEITPEKINNYKASNYKNIDEFSNKLEILKNSIGEFGRGLEINTQRSSIIIPPEMELFDKNKEKSVDFIRIKDDLNSKLKEIEKLYSKDESNYKRKLEEITQEYNPKIKIIDDEIIKIKKWRETLKKKNEEFENYIKFNVNINEVVLIEKYEEFKNRLPKELQELKQREAIEKYNLGVPENKKYFDGTFTKRLTNNILVTPELGNNIKLIENLFNFDVLNLQDIDEFNDMNKDDKLQQIYEPDFKLLLKTQKGGNRIIEDIYKKINIYMEELKITNFEVKKYNIYNINFTTHAYFLTLVATNQLFTEYYVIYRYMNRGILLFYKRILEGLINKMKKEGNNPEILYLKKYHFVSIMILYNFIEKIVPILINKDDIIDIEKCGTVIKNCFTLLNYFKSILESYNEMFQNKITIWGRINNIGKTDLKKNIFVSDYEYKKEINNSTELIDPRKINIIRKNCNKDNKDIDEHIFTEIFDSTQFPDNSDISKYMTLDTQLSKGKGIALMTYGYSGTGKTYTLFGKSDIQKNGLLQSTLDNIIGLKEVKFRIFEIYGYGISFSSYWKSETDPNQSYLNKIKHEIIKYNLELGDNMIDLVSNKASTEIVPSNQIQDFINEDNYLRIKGISASNIFKNFDKFIDKIDTERKDKKRIRDTPNNIVSSRSVLIYDFQLDIGLKKPVTFLIVDLPGREEIAQTYIEPIFNNETIKSIFKNEIPEIKMMLATMSLNPISLPIFYPNFYKEFNLLDVSIRKEIIETELDMKFELLDREESGKFSLAREFINPVGNRFEFFFGIDDYKVKVIQNDKFGYGYLRKSENNLRQYESLLGFHLMNRFIRLNKFVELENIYKKIIDEKINKKIDQLIEGKNTSALKTLLNTLISQRFKGEKSKNTKLIDNNLPTTLTENKNIMKELMRYDYYLTPFEGIYINENIIGLIQYLSTKLVKSGSVINIEDQDLKLNFNYLQKLSRWWLSSKQVDKEEINRRYKGEFEKNNFLFEDNDTTLPYNTKALLSEYDGLRELYKSNKIFNKNKPIITDILNKYINDINDYKVFYLFGNYERDEDNKLKCEHQIKLLENTKDFIKVITS
jgi:hypothetical protein